MGITFPYVDAPQIDRKWIPLKTSHVNIGSAPKLGTLKSPRTRARWTRIHHPTPPRGP